MKDSLILVLNCGSSSIKFSLINLKNVIPFLKGSIEGLNSNNKYIVIKELNKKIYKKKISKNILYEGSIDLIFEIFFLKYKDYIKKIIGIGHRVVHGGFDLKKSEIISEDILFKIKQSSVLAPLHNPISIMGIIKSLKFFPKLKNFNVAVFDTSFHQTMPETSFLYALPYFLYKNYSIRKYGAHGINHWYMVQRSAYFLKKKESEINIISCHLGSGSSVTAIVNGCSVDTSMGLTPLEGLVMSTRCGDIDPSIIFYLLEHCNMNLLDVKNLLIKKSGLLGINEISGNFKYLEDNYDNNKKIKKSIDIFCYRLAKYISGYTVLMNNRLDAIVFTGGVGENSVLVRQKTVSLLSFINFHISNSKNIIMRLGKSGFIHRKNSIPILVICSNEDKVIALETLKLIS